MTLSRRTPIQGPDGRIIEVWGEEGKNRGASGEFIQRVGLGNFLEAIGLEPQPEMVKHPR